MGAAAGAGAPPWNLRGLLEIDVIDHGKFGVGSAG